MNELINEIFNTIKQYIAEKDQKPVINYKEPSQLRERIDFTVENEPIGDIKFKELVDKYLAYSVRTQNKQFLNQLYGGFNLPAFLGDVITTLTNTSMYTYEVAPVASVIEKEMIDLMKSYAGYDSGDGIFLSGGSNANMVAMFSARNRACPDIRFNGSYQCEQLIAFVNEDAHYSYDTAANVLGIGSANLIKIPATANGGMNTVLLEEAILKVLSEGKRPFFVGATCSTTMQGAYDPLDEIYAVTSRYNIWLHADGAFGGSILLSDKNRHVMKGIEKTDSFSWDPHKLMNIPLVCSVILTREKGILEGNLTDINTDYIFHDNEDLVDLGKKSIQCGRHVDAVKLWFAWKYYGKEGYQQRIDHMLELSKYAEDIVKENPSLELLFPRQSFTICFRATPPYETNLNEFNLQVRENLRKSGKSMINYGYIGDQLAIRLITSNNDLTKEDLDHFFSLFLDHAEIIINANLVKDEAEN